MHTNIYSTKSWQSLRTRRIRRHRNGVAAVEAAIAMPFFLLLLLATIDCCCCISLKQSLTVAAYEGARVAVVPGSTTTNIEAQVQQILDERNVENASISVSPSSFSGLALGDLVTVTVTAQANANSPISMGLFSSTQPKAAVTMMIED